MSSNDNTNLKRKSTDSPTESTSPATKHIKLENGTGTPSAVAMNGQNQNPPVAGGPPAAAGQQQQPGARPLQSAPITQTIQMVNAILSQNIGMSSDQKEKYRAGIMSLQRVVQSEPPGSEKHQQAQTKIDQIVAHLRGLAARQQQQQQNVQPPPVDRSVNPLSAASRWIPPPNIPPQDADKWRAEIAQKLQAIGLKLQTHKQTLHDLQTADRSGMTPEQQQDTNKRMAEAQQQIQQWKEVLQKFSAQQKALQQAKQQVPPQVASQRPPGAPQQPPQAPQIQQQQQQQQPQPVPMAQSQSQGGVVQQQQQVRPQGTPQQQPAIVNRPVQQTPTPQAVPMQQQPSQQQQIQQQQQQQMGQPGGVPPRVSTPGIEVGRSGTPANINNHLHNINQQRQLQQAQAQAQNIQMQQHQQQQQAQMSPNTPGQTPAQALLPGQPRPLQQQQHPPPSTPITQGPINTPTTIPATPIHPGNQTPLTATAQGIPLQQQQQRIQPGQQIPIQPGQLPPQHPINMHRDNAAGSQKMPIPPTLTVNTPVATQMPPSRPTLTGGANMPTNHVMGTPGLIKQPQFRFDEDGGYGLLSKRKLEELVKQIDPDEKLDPDVEESVLELVDEFIDTIASTACKMAKLRGSDTLDIKDIQIILERNWNIRIPGFSADEIRTVRKFNPSSQYHHKMSALQAQKQLAQSGKDGP